MTVDAASGTNSVTEAELIDRARALAPLLVENRLKTRELRRLPDAIVSALKENQFFKACQPAKFGGFELPYGTSMNVAAELARSCGSTGWVASVMGVHHWMLAKFDLQAQDDVWGDNPDSVVASAFRFAGGDVVAIDGGYQVSGRVLYASGIDLVDWVMMGTPPLPQPDGPPAKAFMLVPKSDFTIHDTWRSPGLSGTGTNDFEVENIFVPSHRVITYPQINEIETPGSKTHGSVYRLPLFGPFNYSIAAPALGLAQGALEHFCENMGARTDISRQKRIAENATLQVRTSEAAAEIDCAQLLFDTDVARMRSATGSASLSAEDVARIIRNAAYVATLCKRAAARLVETMGAGGLTEDNFVHLAYADIQAASVHITTVWDFNAQPYGRALLGVEDSGPVP